MATDEEIAEQTARVRGLREQLTNDRLAREARERELSNEITMAQLKVEETRLSAEIAEEQSRGSSVVSSTAAPIAAVKEAMEQAIAMQKAVADQVTSDKKSTTPASAPTLRAKVASEKTDQEKGK